MKDAFKDKIQRLSQKQLDKELMQAYKERFDEDKELNEEWEQATIEN